MKYCWLLTIILFSSTFVSCQSQNSTSSEHETMVGFIAADSESDDPNFTLCRDGISFPYYSFGINEERNKKHLSAHFMEQLKHQFDADLNAYLTIRFLVNCKGKTGRFRKEAMNKQYEAISVDEEVWKAFIAAIKSYEDWQLGYYEKKSYDYNIYVTLKIENGKLIEVLP